MNLDFSGLRELSARSSANPAQDGLAKTSTGHQASNSYLQAMSDKNRAAIEDAFRIRKEYQENILLSDGLRCEINKDLRAGKDVYAILLKAIKAISLMTRDTAMLTAAKRDLEKMYGYVAIDNEKGV